MESLCDCSEKFLKYTEYLNKYNAKEGDNVENLMKSLKGSYAVAFTPFYEDGRIDYDEFRKEIEYLSKTGTQAIVLYGMTSEYHKINDDEKKELTTTFLDVLKDKKDVVSVLSVTDWSTEVAVKRAQEYEALGVDMLMCMPPFYFSPHIDEVKRHMIQMVESVKIPVILQYAPLATKMYIEEHELVEISNKYPNAGFKIEYKPAKDFLKKFMELKRDMPILTGWGGLDIVDLFEIGIKGVMTVGGFTELYVAIYNYLENGEGSKAKELYDRMNEYLVKWMINPESLLAIEKEILFRRGILKNSYCRRPRYNLTEENSIEIDDFLADFEEYLK